MARYAENRSKFGEPVSRSIEQLPTSPTIRETTQVLRLAGGLLGWFKPLIEFGFRSLERTQAFISVPLPSCALIAAARPSSGLSMGTRDLAYEPLLTTAESLLKLMPEAAQE